MAAFVFNISKGRTVQFYDNVKSNNPANSALVLIAIATSATDATLKDFDTLAAVLGDANTAEVTNTGYARKILTDTDLGAWAPDDTNDRVDLDIPDQVWASVLAGDNWTDLIICYDPDTTGGTDANIIPIAQYDFAITTDGTDITAKINDAGFYRAS